MKRTLFAVLLVFLYVAPVYGQAVAGDELLKGQPDIANAEISATAAIASSKLATDVLAEGDVGAGLSVTTNTLNTQSDETGFIVDLGASDLTCGAATSGQMAVNDADALQYCDGASTAVRRIAAFGADDGDALAGDSATAFFDAGAIEAARGGTGIDTSGSTGTLRVSGGTWSADAGVSHLATSSSADLRGVLNDETGGTGVAVFNINPTLTDVTVDDLITFSESAGDATCGAGDYWIKGNSTLGVLRGCEDGTAFTFSTGLSPISIATPEALTIAAGVITATCGADNICAVDVDTEASAASDDLTTIECTAGAILYLRAANAARTVVLQAIGAPDFSMDNVADMAVVRCTATDTVELVSRSNGGA